MLASSPLICHQQCSPKHAVAAEKRELNFLNWFDAMHRDSPSQLDRLMLFTQVFNVILA
jgi:hypothetical protein